MGWAIAGVTLVASGLMFWKSSSDKNRIETIFTLISKRDVKSYKLAIVELNERIVRINNESKLLQDAINSIREFGVDYETMTEEQQYRLGVYLNLMLSSTQLLVNPIKGILPKFDEEQWDKYIASEKRKTDDKVCKMYKPLIISLANLLYKIELDDKDKHLLFKTFKNNKKMLSAMNLQKKKFLML